MEASEGLCECVSACEPRECCFLPSLLNFCLYQPETRGSFVYVLRKSCVEVPLKAALGQGSLCD